MLADRRSSALLVAVEPDFSSKSRTGSMMAQRRVTGSETTYWMLEVRCS
jgi:hypothetical protein